MDDSMAVEYLKMKHWREYFSLRSHVAAWQISERNAVAKLRHLQQERRFATSDLICNIRSNLQIKSNFEAQKHYKHKQYGEYLQKGTIEPSVKLAA